MEAHTRAVPPGIHTEEGKPRDGVPIYEAVLLKARDLGLAGATAPRGC